MAPRTKLTGKLVHPADRARMREAEREKRPAVGQGVVTEQPAYNPDGWPTFMNESGEKPISEYEHHRRMGIPMAEAKAGKVDMRGRVAILSLYKGGKLVEAYRGRKGWDMRITEAKHDVAPDADKWIVEMRRIRSYAEFNKLKESTEWVTSKLLESQSFDGFAYGSDQGGVGVAPNNEFIPLMGGPFNKQLYLTDYLDMQAKCFWIRHHHPLGAAIVNTTRNYVIGKGVKLLFKNPDCQKSWDDFCKRADFGNFLRTDVETLVWGGEIMTEKIKVSDNGSMRPSVDAKDPSTIWEIVTEPENIKNVMYYHQQYPTQWQLVYKPGDVSSQYVINDIPADKIIHIKVNATPGEKRGRSMLFPVISWLKRYRDYLNAKVVKAQMDESWAMEIVVDGNQADVTRIANEPLNRRVPPAGSTRVHNKDVEYKILQPSNSSTQGRDDVADKLLTVIAVGAGVSPDWIGGAQGLASTRATAFVKESPATRNIEDMQKIVEGYLLQVKDYVIGEDQKAGLISDTQKKEGNFSKLKDDFAKRDLKAMVKEAMNIMGVGEEEPIDTSCEVIFPEFNTEDRTAKISDIIKGEQSRFITHARASELYAKEMNITSYDYDEEQAAMDEEASQGIGQEWNMDGQQFDENGKPISGAAGSDGPKAEKVAAKAADKP